jgi:hypothetical protein
MPTHILSTQSQKYNPRTLEKVMIHAERILAPQYLKYELQQLE